jgi:hypothetical protein
MMAKMIDVEPVLETLKAQVEAWKAIAKPEWVDARERIWFLEYAVAMIEIEVKKQRGIEHALDAVSQLAQATESNKVDVTKSPINDRKRWTEEERENLLPYAEGWMKYSEAKRADVRQRESSRLGRSKKSIEIEIYKLRKRLGLP